MADSDLHVGEIDQELIGTPGAGGDGDPTQWDKPGRRVGRFRIIQEIGAGGMGVVYKALDEALGRHVALKHPRADVKDSENIRKRFVREARATSRLFHPNVVPIFEVFEFEGMPWLAMELVEGGSLRDRMKAKGPLPLLEILEHCECLAGALAAAHGLGILHRDVKPANVLLDARGQARLMDFGLARRLPSGDRENDETVTRLTEQGHMVGTPGYMSPEQALGRTLDARSDIFCLGLVLYEMCTGRPALDKADSDSWLDSLLHTPPEPIAPLRSDAPEALEYIARKALAKKPEDRYQSAEAMQADLRDLREEVEAGLNRKRILRSRRLRLALKGLALAAMAGLIFTGAWWLKDLVAPGAQRTTWVAKPLTHDPAWAADPALSPDETMIAYASGRSGSGDIWLIDREGGNALQLTDHPSADRRPAWSADGSEVYFTSFRSGEAAIWKVPRLGGTAVLVLPDADDPALSPDGTQMAFVRRNESGHYRIAIAPLDDLENFHYLTTSEDGFWYHRGPQISPDGHQICYHSARDVWVVPSDGGQPKRVTRAGDPVYSAKWSGNKILYSQKEVETIALWQIGADGGRPERISSGGGHETELSPSFDGRLIVYSTVQQRSILVVIDQEYGTTVQLGDLLNPDLAVVAPDGSSVVFEAVFREGWGLFLQPLSEGTPVGPPRTLISQPGSYANPVFSPDGRWLAFHRVLDGQRDIWTLPIDGGVPLRFTIDEAVDATPFFSPDGTHLAFASKRSGQTHIWWAKIKDGKRVGDPEQLTFGQTTDYLPRISGDGSMLAWLGNRGDEENIWVRSLEGPAESRQVTQGRRINGFWWEPEGGTILASGDWESEHLSLRRVFIGDGADTPLSIPVDFGRGDTGGVGFASGLISLSADGRIAVHTQTTVTGDLWMLEKQ
jgi:Tol biopolymer transport system component/tRNA A-37 threonylcarbamoyl transferase component Bud32